MLNTISINKVVMGLISAAIFLVVFFWLFSSNQAGATQVEQCDNVTTYTEDGDFNDSRVDINVTSFDGDSDRRVIINPGTGYVLTFIGVDYTGNDDNDVLPSVGNGTDTITYDAPNNQSIDNVTVSLKKYCEPTPTPTVSPTLTPTPSVTPSPTPTEVPSITPSPTPTEEKKINICHATGSESNPYEAIRVNDDGYWNGHDDHSGDFLYNGPVNPQNDQPLKPEGDEWCEENQPNGTPTPTPSVTPTVTPSPTPQGDTTGKDDPNSCVNRDCSGVGGPTQSVAGASTQPTQGVLGLSATSSNDSGSREMALLFASLLLLAVGARLTIKNA